MSKIEDSVCVKIQERASAGQQKYGVTMEREDLSLKDWLAHAQQEAMDLAVYLEKIIQREQGAEKLLRSVLRHFYQDSSGSHEWSHIEGTTLESRLDPMEKK